MGCELCNGYNTETEMKGQTRRLQVKPRELATLLSIRSEKGRLAVCRHVLCSTSMQVLVSGYVC